MHTEDCGFNSHHFHLSMKKLVARDKQRRNLVQKNLKKRFLLKFLLRESFVLENEELFRKVRKALEKMPRDSSITRLSNRCGYTGRKRGVYKKFKLSRISIRELALTGKIAGVTKSSW